MRRRRKAMLTCDQALADLRCYYDQWIANRTARLRCEEEMRDAPEGVDLVEWRAMAPTWRTTR